MGRLQLISTLAGTSALDRLAKLAAHLGVTFSTSDFETIVNEDNSDVDAFVIEINASVSGISGEMLSALIGWARTNNRSLLFLVTESGPASEMLLRSLTDNLVDKISDVSHPDEISFENVARPFAEELAGSVHKRRPGPALTIETCKGSECTNIMRVGNGASFVTWQAAAGLRFVWSTPNVLDVVCPIGSELEFEEALDQVIPFIIFMRQSFGNAIWSNPYRDAGFIIDDPLLVQRYGFIDFAALLRSARLNSYHVTLAYIPWNSWRAKARETELFREFSDCFSLCVHGCDHNQNEYGSADYSLLADKNRVALERMSRLSSRCGVPFVPVMVCPQEQCSREGWQSLADTTGLVAMANTGCIPRNSTNDRVSVSDLLQPAHDRFFGFPIFKRYYPGKPEQFALTAFLGRPAMLVEHHSFFMNGLQCIEDFVVRLKEICPHVKWRSMSDIVTTTHLRRITSDGALHVRFFADRVRVELPISGTGPIHFRKYVENEKAIETVFANGTSLPFAFENNYLIFTVDQPAPLHIEVKIKRPTLERVYSRSAVHQGGVAIRRLSSEFRDNVLVRSPRFAALARTLVRRLKLTGGS